MSIREDDNTELRTDASIGGGTASASDSGGAGDLFARQAHQRAETHLRRLEIIEKRIQDLRIVFLTPLIAVFFLVIVPDTVLGIVQRDGSPPHGFLEILAGIIMGTTFLFLIWQIRQHRIVIQFVLSALIFMATSQCLRFSKNVQGLDSALLGRWYNLSHTLDNTANGIGLLLLGGATLFAFVELLAARERDHAERERLAEEIEDRIRAEKALRESEERFRTISVSAQDAIIMANQDLEVVYWNPAAQRILGYSREEAVGHSILALLVPKGYDDTVSLDVTSIRRRLSLLSPGRVEEFIVRHKSGGEVLVEVTSTSLTVGGEWHGLAIVRDVTERRQTEQLLQERQAQMINSARLSSLGIMASGLAHEINNPLAIISMAIQELNEALEEDPPRVDQVTRIAAYVERNVLRIERILRGLRNLSRDGGGEPFLEVSLKSIVEDTLELCNARFRMKGVLLDIGEISGDLYVQCRATQVSQILLNLLNNAYDAVEELNERWVRLETTVNDDMLEVSIVDSGKGIPEEVRARILEPFFTTKEVGKGMGLGLSITRSLVEAHSGKLIADTCDGNTRFIVQIPVRHALDEEQGKVAENG